MILAILKNFLDFFSRLAKLRLPTAVFASARRQAGFNPLVWSK
jgi:hypothetical protein